MAIICLKNYNQKPLTLNKKPCGSGIGDMEPLQGSYCELSRFTPGTPHWVCDPGLLICNLSEVILQRNNWRVCAFLSLRK